MILYYIEFNKHNDKYLPAVTISFRVILYKLSARKFERIYIGTIKI